MGTSFVPAFNVYRDIAEEAICLDPAHRLFGGSRRGDSCDVVSEGSDVNGMFEIGLQAGKSNRSTA